MGQLIFFGILFFGSGVAAVSQPLAPGEPAGLPALVLGVGLVLLLLAGLLVLRAIASGHAKKRLIDQLYPYRNYAPPLDPNAEAHKAWAMWEYYRQ